MNRLLKLVKPQNIIALMNVKAISSLLLIHHLAKDFLKELVESKSYSNIRHSNHLCFDRNGRVAIILDQQLNESP